MIYRYYEINGVIIMAGAAFLKDLLLLEVIQLSDEGKEIDVDCWREKIKKCDKQDKDALMAIYNQLCDLPERSDFSYNEPSEYEDILKESKIQSLEEENFAEIDFDYFHGAWLGRCIGCAWGQPCENWRSKDIIQWYKNAGKYPIKSYLPTNSGEKRNEGLATDEMIKSMPIDDDTRFTVLNYLLIKNKGLNFDGWDVADHWTRYLPYRVIFTAETQAYLNFINLDECIHFYKPENAAEILKNNKVNTYLNPYREWIGAQIRADAFGYLAAGKPKLASKLAYTDAYFTHTKNGVYGEMFFAALIACAFTEKDAEKCFEKALAVIPENSRFYEEMVWAKDLALSDISRDELVEILVEKANRYNSVHTINNAAFCIAAIMRYKNDFREAVAFSIECGLDTDCNGATVGSFMGALLGEKGVPADLSKALNDTFSVGVHPYDEYSIKKFANQVKELYEELNR